MGHRQDRWRPIATSRRTAQRPAAPRAHASHAPRLIVLSSGDQSFVIDKQNRALSIIGAPSSAGAYAPGQEKAPAAFRRHGLADVLSHSGHNVTDRGDVLGFRWRPDPTRAK